MSTMGSRPTKMPVLQCPDGYDPQQFKRICSLFDKLDKDSNMGVSSDEIEHIAALHVENCIRRTQGQLTAKTRAFETAKTQIVLDEELALARVRQEFDMRRQHEKMVHSVALQSLTQRIATYQGLNADGQANAFMQAVMPKGEEHMDFWSFFEYMKNRTDDIANIQEK